VAGVAGHIVLRIWTGTSSRPRGARSMRDSSATSMPSATATPPSIWIRSAIVERSGAAG
jgi:hypothetical protein